MPGIRPTSAARFEFFLVTGMREQDVMHCYWSDINFAASTVRVSHKPDLGWTPKASELVPENFWLHKFRATFATMQLQVWYRPTHGAGHMDLASTMRYLTSAPCGR